MRQKGQTKVRLYLFEAAVEVSLIEFGEHKRGQALQLALLSIQKVPVQQQDRIY
jgi:hypothetical protein